MDQPTPRKGLPPWAWVGIGCGCLIVISFVVVSVGGFFAARKAKEVFGDFEKDPAAATARLVAAFNPDLEVVETDEGTGRVTLRDRKTGKVATFDFEDVKEGKIRFESDEGETTLDLQSSEDGGTMTIEGPDGTVRYGAGSGRESLPDWVPLPRGARVGEGGYSSTAGGARTGLATFETDQKASEVLDFYREKLEEEGFRVQTTTFDLGGEDGPRGTVIGTDEGAGRTLTVTVVVEGTSVRAALQYQEKG